MSLEENRDAALARLRDRAAALRRELRELTDSEVGRSPRPIRRARLVAKLRHVEDRIYLLKQLRLPL